MPRFACHTCGKIGSTPYCPEHKPEHRSPSSRATGHRTWRQHIRPLILRRDRGICHICGKSGADQVDHLEPASKNPRQALSRDLSRYAAAHASCNNSKGNRT